MTDELEDDSTECPHCGSYVWNGCFAHCPSRAVIAPNVGEVASVNRRITELETALKDALWAWGLVQAVAEEHSTDSGWPWRDKRDYEEAEERIQKARAVLQDRKAG